MLKAVLFDLDQTLIDWTTVEERWEDYQFKRVQAVYDYTHANVSPLDGVTVEDLFAAFRAAMDAAWQRGVETLVPPHIRQVLAEALTAVGVPEEKLDLDALLEVYDWQPPKGLRAYPDVLEVLPEFARHGVELGIVTNASHPMTLRDRELAAAGIDDLFPRCRVSAADVGYLKPHRRIFEQALAELGVAPEEAVFVGDNLNADIRGAQAAGMRAVWRPDGDAPTLPEIVPDGVIATLHDLLPLLDRWYPGWRRNGHRA